MTDYQDFRDELLNFQDIPSPVISSEYVKGIYVKAKRLNTRIRILKCASIMLWIVYAIGLGVVIHMKANTSFYGVDDVTFLEAYYEQNNKLYLFIYNGLFSVLLLAILSTLLLFIINRKHRLD